MRIRPLTPADRAAWLPLWEGYLRFYRAELSPEVTQVAFRRLAAGDAGCFALVADAGDALHGLAHCVLHASTWQTTPVCYLEDLYVAPAARGTNLGRALFEGVYAAADARGAGRVYWHTQSYNARARSLYDVVGIPTSFVVYERR